MTFANSDKPRPANHDTPMLRQFYELKEQAPECILFFRMGDFYEMFLEDAKVASKVLGIQLTSRDKGSSDPVPMCGVPYRALDSYLAKMVEANFKVAVCDQVEDPKKAKGLVRREITRVASPGMFIDPQHLDAGSNRFLAALCIGKDQVGLSCLDLSSGEFMACALPPGPALADELARLEPAELVIAESQSGHILLSQLGPAADVARTAYRGRPPTANQARDILDTRLGPETDQAPPAAVMAAAMAWSVVLATQKVSPEHVQELNFYQVDSHLVLDANARRNLEMFRSIAGGRKKGSLLSAVDRTVTAMGARLLKEWLGFPLLRLEPMEARHQAVEELTQDPLLMQELREELDKLPDLPRLVGRVSLGQAGPRDLAALRDALLALPGLTEIISRLVSPLLAQQGMCLMGLEALAAELDASLVEHPPISLAEGGVLAAGLSAELDEQRGLQSQGKSWIAGLQAGLRSDTGIPSLKVGFNKVFGYYIEVTKTHLSKVPESFIRKQTLANAERYFTPQLKEREAEVLGAEEKALALERELFEELRLKVAGQAKPLMACARALAGLDVISALSALALSQDYVRPHMSPGGPLIIKGGRHPVVEQMLPPGDFVPNDVHLDMTENQVLIITGPNMAGKSTILRQVALIVALAQAGSFVPAASAQIPLVDRIFTRVGAMDDLAGGRSTFMVEMTETSQILKQASQKSLVILDEVGRGTSTFDGLSLAWAVAEHLHGLAGQGVKTLFATHYHELTELAADHQRVKNYNVAVKEYQGGIVFLRKLTPGGVSRSYGLQVARLAGVPEEVIARARQILGRLENGQGPRLAPDSHQPDDAGQMALFAGAGEHPVLTKLKELDPLRLTPLEALAVLDELKRELD